jgi:hypothetical protein
MKLLRLTLGLTMIGLFFVSCEKYNQIHDGKHSHKKAMYTVTVENVFDAYNYFQSGVVAVPEGASDPGPALPGHSYKFSFYAGPKHMLSFATMYGFSNDGFYAPDGMGISLYDSGNPLAGDITSQVMLWDAGTEMNQMPGMGNMHDGADENGMVMLMADVGDGYDYGTVVSNLMVTLEYNGNHMFTVTIDNMSGSTTAISPVAWVVHSMDNPLFETGMADYGKGLEDLAETGNASVLGDYLAMNSGYVSPVAPGVWVLHDNKEKPVFTVNMPDYGKGLEQLAEMGDPSVVHTSLMSEGYQTGVYNTPDGAASPAPIFPGETFTFMFEAYPGQRLSIASMLGASNDLFLGTDDDGFTLSDSPGKKDITKWFSLWDAGTEVNEYPGTQTQANTVEGGNVRMVNDGFPYPMVDDMIKVTIMRN